MLPRYIHSKPRAGDVQSLTKCWRCPARGSGPLSSLGIEPRFPQPQCGVLATVRTRPTFSKNGTFYKLALAAFLHKSHMPYIYTLSDKTNNSFFMGMTKKYQIQNQLSTYFLFIPFHTCFLLQYIPFLHNPTLSSKALHKKYAVTWLEYNWRKLQGLMSSMLLCLFTVQQANNASRAAIWRSK